MVFCDVMRVIVPVVDDRLVKLYKMLNAIKLDVEKVSSVLWDLYVCGFTTKLSYVVNMIIWVLSDSVIIQIHL